MIRPARSGLRILGHGDNRPDFVRCGGDDADLVDGGRAGHPRHVERAPSPLDRLRECTGDDRMALPGTVEALLPASIMAPNRESRSHAVSFRTGRWPIAGAIVDVMYRR